MSKPDLKQVRHLDLECRFTSANEGVVEGIASRWEEEDSYGDVIERGAFSASLAQHRERGTFPAMLWLHREPAGVWEVIEERAEGLYVKGRFALSTNTGREAHEHAKAGTTTGLSIGFHYDEVEFAADGTWRVKSVTLHEISLTPTPAAPRARITNVRQTGVTMPDNIDPVTTPETRTIPNPPAPAAPDYEARFAEMQTRMDELEVRAQRVPAAARNENEQAEREVRALASYLRTGSDAEIRAASSTPDADGGFMILPTVDRTIRNLMEDTSPLLGLVENVSISGNTYERFYSKGNRGAVWVAETETRPTDTARPELIKHSYGVKELYAEPVGTRHLFEDASIDVAAWFNQWVASDIALCLGDAFWTGDGVDGKPRGILTHNIVATSDKTRAWGDIEYVPAGHASTPTDDNLAKALVALVLTLHSRFRGNARLITTAANYIRFRQLQDTAKRFLWAATGNLVESAENGSLLGVPIVIDDHLDDISVGAGANIAAIGDFSQAYVHVNRHGIRTERDAVTKPGWIKLPSFARHGGGLGDSRAIKILKIAAS